METDQSHKRVQRMQWAILILTAFGCFFLGFYVRQKTAECAMQTPCFSILNLNPTLDDNGLVFARLNQATGQITVHMIDTKTKKVLVRDMTERDP